MRFPCTTSSKASFSKMYFDWNQQLRYSRPYTPPPFITLPPKANALLIPLSTSTFVFVVYSLKPPKANLLKITFSPLLSRTNLLRVFAVLNWKMKKGTAINPPMIIQLTLIQSSSMRVQVQKPVTKQTRKAMDIALILIPSWFQYRTKPSCYSLSCFMWIDGVLSSGFPFLILEKEKERGRHRFQLGMLNMICFCVCCVSEDMRFSIFMILLLVAIQRAAIITTFHIHLHPSAAILLLYELSALLGLLHQLGSPHLALCWLHLSWLAVRLGDRSLLLSSYCFCWFFLGQFDIGGGSLKLIAFEQFHTSISEQFFQVFSSLSGHFKVGGAYILQFFFGVIAANGPLFVLVYLVANDDHVDIIPPILFYVVEPHVQVLEAVAVGHVVDQEDRVGVTQITRDQTSETLLPSCVPELQAHRLLLYAHVL